MSGKIKRIAHIILLISAAFAAFFFMRPQGLVPSEPSPKPQISIAQLDAADSDYLFLSAQRSDIVSYPMSFTGSRERTAGFADVADIQHAKHIMIRPAKIIYEKLETDLPYISITFDDCPIGYAEEILDVLREYDMRATFFVIGAYAATYPEITQRIVDDGHTIANHTFTHKKITDITDFEFTKEVQSTEYAVARITGKKTTLFRPPQGSIDNRQIARLAEMGYTIALWSVDSLDWQHPEGAIERAKAAGPGDIVLFHTKSLTGDDLRVLLEYYKEQGLTSLPVEELAAISYASKKGLTSLTDRGFDFDQPQR